MYILSLSGLPTHGRQQSGLDLRENVNTADTRAHYAEVNRLWSLTYLFRADNDLMLFWAILFVRLEHRYN